MQAKLNAITIKMIADVVREHLTPVQLNFNIEVKSIKRIVDDH